MQKILSDIENFNLRLDSEGFETLKLPTYTGCKIASLLQKSPNFGSFSDIALGVFNKALLN